MRKKTIWWLVSLVIIGFLGIAFYGIRKNAQTQILLNEDSNQNISSYFLDLPITGWTDTSCPSPCISIGTRAEKFSALVDLGFAGQFSLNREALSRIEPKQYIGCEKRYGFDGKEYEKKIYILPEISLQSIKITEPYVQDQSPDFLNNASICEDNEEPSMPQPATVGWQFFSLFNAFFDLNNGKIALCSSLNDLNAEGYSIDSFIKTPLFHNRGLLEIETKTADGIKRCVLDTGCTVNALNNSSLIGQAKIDVNNTCEFSKFYISDVNFGPVELVHLPIQLPLHVDVILGMEFFIKNIVFLDFANGMAYFAPSSKIALTEKLSVKNKD